MCDFKIGPRQRLALDQVAFAIGIKQHRLEHLFQFQVSTGKNFGGQSLASNHSSFAGVCINSLDVNDRLQQVSSGTRQITRYELRIMDLKPGAGDPVVG